MQRSTVKWYKDGKIFQTSQQRFSLEITDDNIYLRTIYDKDAGTYICDFVLSEDNSHWIVRRVLTVKTIVKEADKKPTILDPHGEKTLEVQLGTPLELSCKVYFDFERHFSPVIRWLLNEETDSGNTRFEQGQSCVYAEEKTGKTLIYTAKLKEVTEMDLNSNFICFAQNFVGNSTALLKLKKKKDCHWYCGYQAKEAEHFPQYITKLGFNNDVDDFINRAFPKLDVTEDNIEFILQTIQVKVLFIGLQYAIVQKAMYQLMFLPFPYASEKLHFEYVLEKNNFNKLFTLPWIRDLNLDINDDDKENFLRNMYKPLREAQLKLMQFKIINRLYWTPVKMNTIGLRPNNLYGKQFDAFVSYATHNSTESSHTSDDSDVTEEKFAVTLLPEILEKQYGYKLCLTERDILPGGAYIEDIATVIKRSRRVIFVLSPTYMNGQRIFELQAGINSMLEDHTIKLILIDFKPFSITKSLPHNIKKALKVLPMIRWKGLKSNFPSSKFWKTVRYHMPAKRASAWKNASKEPFSSHMDNMYTSTFTGVKEGSMDNYIYT
nr:PREDICTED: interleukin-18 receptor accessory protein [Latimeria chalumnae]|eukprot:XP_014346278.1 PREDICTED: interleukin-18 receptor accessory protein [Latimeria chalumnae]